VKHRVSDIDDGREDDQPADLQCALAEAGGSLVLLHSLADIIGGAGEVCDPCFFSPECLDQAHSRESLPNESLELGLGAAERLAKGQRAATLAREQQEHGTAPREGHQRDLPGQRQRRGEIGRADDGCRSQRQYLGQPEADKIDIGENEIAEVRPAPLREPPPVGADGSGKHSDSQPIDHVVSYPVGCHRLNVDQYRACDRDAEGDREQPADRRRHPDRVKKPHKPLGAGVTAVQAGEDRHKRQHASAWRAR